MTLAIGIIGLPNVGKSTTFNALTRTQQAQVENYPFCTIEPNRAIVPVPDERVDKLAQLVEVPQAIHTTVEFVDIAGLVAGASRGEGLGNQFLGQIRNTAAIVHVVRCFDDENVVHVSGQPQPGNDIEIVNLELMLADSQQLEGKIERLTGQAKADKKARPLLELAHHLQAELAAGNPITVYPDQEDETFRALTKEMQFLTAQPVIYAANVDEAALGREDNTYVQEVQAIAAQQGAPVVTICAQLEAEMAGFTAKERAEFLQLAGVDESGLEQIIHTGYRTLGLLSFFTMNENEVRAWRVREGATAPQAAGVIHTDFERGFIRAEVVDYETFVRHGSMAAARSAGELRQEGKGYVVQDGDVIYFRFNV